ncbi:MAG: hypothetical protein CMP10_10875 [Zetaproteobacteria bacterium]|nr:hypothetical protein [Pseudobdellovibrionaceae bacterium]
MDEEFALKVLPVFKGLRAYHRHKIIGINNIPKTGPAIIACNHSLATYDIMLLMAAVFQDFQRFPRALIDKLFYKLPGLGRLMERLGCVVGDPANANTLLNNGELLYVAPGGMQESLRSSNEKYQIKWKERKGFTRLSIETGAPIILAACPKADDIFTIYENKFTSWFYQKMKLPVFLAKGLGFSLLPKPIILTHSVSKPIYPPKPTSEPQEMENIINQFHEKIIKEMDKTISAALRYGECASLPTAKQDY